jgi:uncharacterized protein
MGAPGKGITGMGERRVGRVVGLWRYPVKSMRGEVLDQVEIDGRGVCGDRAYALWDHATARVASAKNPLLWKALLGYEARFTAPVRPDAPPPPVAIQEVAGGAPNEPMHSSDPGLNERLSALLGRQVSLLDRPPAAASLDQYWPPVEGRAYQNVVNELVLPEGTFFDACPIHAISTATLAQLRRLEPSLDFAVERFRPNLLIEPEAGAEGFVEEAWAGHTLRLGTGPELLVEGGCPRCVITTLPQGDLPEAMGILRATARHNEVVAGIRLAVARPGRVALGEAVTLVEAG